MNTKSKITIYSMILDLIEYTNDLESIDPKNDELEDDLDIYLESEEIDKSKLTDEIYCDFLRTLCDNTVYDRIGTVRRGEDSKFNEVQLERIEELIHSIDYVSKRQNK